MPSGSTPGENVARVNLHRPRWAVHHPFPLITLVLVVHHLSTSPHDEAPEVVNEALVNWLHSIGYKS